MAIEQELKRLAELYASQGYKVVVEPAPSELPPFAQDFDIELVGRRGGEGVLVSAKKDRHAAATDTEVARYAEITAGQVGWRFDFAVLGSEPAQVREMRGAQDFVSDDINRALSDAERMIQLGFVRAGIITAWSALEAAMRIWLRAAGEEAGWGTGSRSMINELYSSGAFAPDEFAELERLAQVRNQIVHGFNSPAAAPEVVSFMASLAHRLLEESQHQRQVS